jgi:CBS domain containing-hemolysin-like protein
MNIAGDELEDIVEKSDGSFEMLGSTEIGKIEQLFDMEIEADDFTTIAGLVINESGKVPLTGDRLLFRGLEVEVVEADERRIGRIRVKRAETSKASELSRAK